MDELGDRSRKPASVDREGVFVVNGGAGGGTRRRSRSSAQSELNGIMVDENVLSDEEPFDDVADLLKLPDWQMPRIWKRTSNRW